MLKTMLRTSVLVSLGFASTVFADSDPFTSDVSAGAEFASIVEDAQGVIVRVPVDANGEEATSGMEMRLHTGDELSSSEGVATAFEEAVTMTNVPVMSDREAAEFSADSSTWGWNNYSHRNDYRHYRPTYHHRDHRFSFSFRGFFRISWGHSHRRNYNYYYYCR